MKGRAAIVGAALTSVVLLVTPAIALGPGIDRSAAAADAAERGEQVQINPPPQQPASATYRVTFRARWTSASHPGTTPFNAHFSPPVLAVHAVPGAMFVPGAPASAGIEDMAERGRTGQLVAEMNANGNVSGVLTQSGVSAPAIADRSFTITATQSADLVSLVTMLAPSSDWFVGMRDVDLFTGEWLGSTTIVASNYDAGTRNGNNFSIGGDTAPRGVITGPVDSGFIAAAAQNPFATITITRIG